MLLLRPLLCGLSGQNVGVEGGGLAWPCLVNLSPARERTGV